jgi:hypothetical protein
MRFVYVRVLAIIHDHSRRRFAQFHFVAHFLNQCRLLFQLCAQLFDPLVLFLNSAMRLLETR